METFTGPREFVEHPRYSADREKTLAALDLGSIDAPIVDIVSGFNALPHCYTMQSCYGHFVCSAGQDSRTLEPIPPGHSGTVRYRIAYVAFCLENSSRGRILRALLARVSGVAPGYIQFGTAEWFWKHCLHVNTYVLQVEPAAHHLEDEAVLDITEALRTQRARNLFFAELRAVVAAEQRKDSAC